MMNDHFYLGLSILKGRKKGNISRVNKNGTKREKGEAACACSSPRRGWKRIDDVNPPAGMTNTNGHFTCEGLQQINQSYVIVSNVFY